MSAPAVVAGERLVRSAWYLGHPERKCMRHMFKWRVWEPILEVWTGSEKSIGARRALSSAEAELYAANKGAAEGIGAQSITNDFGDEVRTVLRVGTGAAIGFVGRRGLCRLRHVHVR